MGEKFSDGIRKRLRERVDGLERALVQNDPELDGFVSKTSIGPPVRGACREVRRCGQWRCGDGAANHRVYRACVAAHAPSLREAIPHPHASHLPSTGRDQPESKYVHQREFDRCPTSRSEGGGKAPNANHQPWTGCRATIRRWPNCTTASSDAKRARCPTAGARSLSGRSERIEAGDWTAGVFRAPELANAAFDVSTDASLLRMEDQNMVPSAVLLGGAQLQEFGKADANAPGGFPVLESKSAEAQRTIRGVPDQHRAPKRSVPMREWIEVPGIDGLQHPDTARRILNQACPPARDGRAGYRHRRV